MIVRIPQREQDDCVISAVAMIMGPPYTYDRVLMDSGNYEQICPDGMFPAWWETYLRNEGFQFAYRPFMELYNLIHHRGRVVGLLNMDFPHLNKGHIVAVDEVGVIDPADGSPDHIALEEYIRPRISQGAKFHDEFLAVWKPISKPSGPDRKVPKPLARFGRMSEGIKRQLRYLLFFLLLPCGPWILHAF